MNKDKLLKEYSTKIANYEGRHIILIELLNALKAERQVIQSRITGVVPQVGSCNYDNDVLAFSMSRTQIARLSKEIYDYELELQDATDFVHEFNTRTIAHEENLRKICEVADKEMFGLIYSGEEILSNSVINQKDRFDLRECIKNYQKGFEDNYNKAVNYKTLKDLVDRLATVKSKPIELPFIFVNVYTNRVKEYCEKEFFDALVNAVNYYNSKCGGINCSLYIVDNTFDKEEERLAILRNMSELQDARGALAHIDINQSPSETLFMRNVTESVQLCVNRALAIGESNNKDWHFMLAESDVILPEDGIYKLVQSFLSLRQGPEELVTSYPGAVGGIYYTDRYLYHGNNKRTLFKGYHDQELLGKGLVKTETVLSGIALYNRGVIATIPFRYDPAGAFPDACISLDMRNQDWRLYNDYSLYCEHLAKDNGQRGAEELIEQSKKT